MEKTALRSKALHLLLYIVGLLQLHQQPPPPPTPNCLSAPSCPSTLLHPNIHMVNPSDAFLLEPIQRRTLIAMVNWLLMLYKSSRARHVECRGVEYIWEREKRGPWMCNLNCCLCSPSHLPHPSYFSIFPGTAWGIGGGGGIRKCHRQTFIIPLARIKNNICQNTMAAVGCCSRSIIKTLWFIYI